MTTATDHEEWLEMEADQPEIRTDGHWLWPHDTGCKYIDKPHPKSYRPDLPLRSELRGRQTKKWTLTKTEREGGAFAIVTPVLVPREIVRISRTRAHPDSYRPEIPLRGLGLNHSTDRRKWTITAADKATFADRPLTFHQARMI